MRTLAPLIPAEQLLVTWREYKTTFDPALRDKLILHYQQLVIGVAKRIGVTLPSHIDDEDLISYGMFGLLDAIDKFDLDRGIKFETYASTRIRGAIIDELRAIDWVPRSVRSQIKAVKEATEGLEATLNRAPTSTEIAVEMSIPMAELNKARSQQNFIHVVALDAMVDPDGESEYSLMNQIEDQRTDNPTSSFETGQIRNALAKAVAVLPEREAIVLCLYYYEGLTLAEIGKALHVTESRVCQMHTRAMSVVRSRLAVA